jgi:hypothetical protein
MPKHSKFLKKSEKMKNIFKYLWFVLFFGALKLQAMDCDEATLLMVNERAGLYDRLKAYVTRVSVNWRFEKPKDEFLLIYTIGLECVNRNYANLEELLYELITEDSSKIGEAKQAIEIIKNQRDVLLKKSDKNSGLKIILKQTKSADKNCAISAYFDLINYTIPESPKKDKPGKLKRFYSIMPK